MKIGHVHLKVTDLEEAVAFYETVLDLEVRERAGNYVFMSGTSAHHELALQEVSGSPAAKTHQPGLYHVASEVQGDEQLRRAYERAEAFGCDPKAVDHGISESFYLRDPSGNGVEVYRDTRPETGREDWNQRSKPLSLKGRDGND
ncbi:MAG: VOC family protein [bacterium]